MTTDPKMIPISRIPYGSNTSPDHSRRVVKKLESENVIKPEWTSTGRGYLSVGEWEIVRAHLCAQRDTALTGEATP